MGEFELEVSGYRLCYRGQEEIYSDDLSGPSFGSLRLSLSLHPVTRNGTFERSQVGCGERKTRRLYDNPGPSERSFDYHGKSTE